MAQRIRAGAFGRHKGGQGEKRHFASRCSHAGCCGTDGHLGICARDTSFAAVSRAPIQNILQYKKRMGWKVPRFSSSESDFNVDFGVTKGKSEGSGTSVFFRDGDNVFRTYFTTGRGDEMLRTVWAFLDLTPLGRQET